MQFLNGSYTSYFNCRRVPCWKRLWTWYRATSDGRNRDGGRGSAATISHAANAAFLARRRYGYSATAVAAALGYRGHSSVNYAIARIDEGDTGLADLLAAIEDKLTY